MRTQLGSYCQQFDRTIRPSASELATLLETESGLLRGSSTRQWCREHAFTPPLRDGELSGRRIVESTPVPARCVSKA